LTFDPSQQGQLFNLVVRGLAFLQDHLLVSRWQGGFCFPIGGRLQHGEGLEEAVLREFREETGITASIRKFVYFNENFFVDDAGRAIHELGWYFWVEPERPVGALGMSTAHPDSPRLSLEYVPVAGLASAGLYPRFLVQFLPEDLAADFEAAPRHVVSTG